MVRESTSEARQEQMELINGTKTELILSTGKKVKIGWTLPDTQDKIDTIIVDYESFKKSIKDKEDDKSLNKANSETRKFYSKVVAAILINNFFGIKLFWWLKWRMIHHFWGLSGQDYLSIIAECKKKAQEGEYQLAMALAMDMTTLWTTMTKKEAEEYRQELELVREHQSLKSSQPSQNP